MKITPKNSRNGGFCMIMKRMVVALLAVYCVSVLASDDTRAGSVTLLSSSGTDGGFATSSSATPADPSALGIEFTLNQKTSITEIDLDLKSINSTVAASDVFLQFYTDVSGNIGTYIEQFAFAPSNVTAPYKSVAFTNASGVTLNAGTYYLMLFDSSTNEVGWQEAASATNSSFASVSGKLYNSPGADYVYPIYMTLEMQGSVPEPGSLVLAGSALAIMAGVATLRRRRVARA
jgi:hypothetical protein